MNVSDQWKGKGDERYRIKSVGKRPKGKEQWRRREGTNEEMHIWAFKRERPAVLSERREGRMRILYKETMKRWWNGLEAKVPWGILDLLEEPKKQKMNKYNIRWISENEIIKN